MGPHLTCTAGHLLPRLLGLCRDSQAGGQLAQPELGDLHLLASCRDQLIWRRSLQPVQVKDVRLYASSMMHDAHMMLQPGWLVAGDVTIL